MRLKGLAFSAAAIASLAFELRVEMQGGNLSRAVLRTLESRLVNFGAFLDSPDFQQKMLAQFDTVDADGGGRCALPAALRAAATI